VREFPREKECGEKQESLRERGKEGESERSCICERETKRKRRDRRGKRNRNSLSVSERGQIIRKNEKREGEGIERKEGVIEEDEREGGRKA
jgi:hypothetical protein